MNPHDHIDDYVDGLLSPAERARFERALDADATLRTEVAAVEDLKARAAALPSTATPSPDLWDRIATELDQTPQRPRRWPWVAAGAVAALAAVMLLSVAAGGLWAWWPTGVSGPSADLAVARGQELLKRGEIAASRSAFEEALQSEPSHAEASTSLAFTQLITGDYRAADATLATALTHATAERAPALHLRRALVAQRAHRLDDVQSHGERSGLPAGLVLAAEVYLADAEADAAIPLLRRARQGDDPVVAETARRYLTYLADTESGRAQLAEAVALWALGQRGEGVETAYELLLFMPGRTERRDEELLLWAGRAVASGQPVLAGDLLDSMASPPAGHAWRVQATRAMVSVADGDIDEALDRFSMLEEGGAPLDGLADARLTAASLVPDHPTRRRLLADLGGPGAALLLDDPSRLEERDSALAAYLRRR